MKIYLVRHGETDWNKQRRIQGREDIELNETGISQANKCGQAFKSLNIDMVVSSPLKRAKKTAEIIMSYVGVKELNIEYNLTERDFGRLSGLTMEEIEKIRESGKEDCIEKWETLCTRVKAVLDDYRLHFKANNIIMVSHGAAINSLLALLSNHAIGTGTTYIKNTCISIIECTDNGFEISDYNLAPEEFSHRLICL